MVPQRLYSHRMKTVSSTMNPTIRREISAFMVFFIISIALFNNGNAVYSMKDGVISGTGFGNNGERFGSFISCSVSNTLHYFKGSNIHFKSPLNDNLEGKDSDKFLGTWVINFKTDYSQSPVKIGGLITESNVDHNVYSLIGEETFDNICNSIGNTITLTGECGENTRIAFSDSNKEKVGSIIPPYGDKMYQLFGSEVDCD